MRVRRASEENDARSSSSQIKRFAPLKPLKPSLNSEDPSTLEKVKLAIANRQYAHIQRSAARAAISLQMNKLPRLKGGIQSLLAEAKRINDLLAPRKTYYTNEQLESESLVTEADSQANLTTHLATKAFSFASWVLDKSINMFHDGLWHSGVPSLFENQPPKQLEFPRKLRF